MTAAIHVPVSSAAVAGTLVDLSALGYCTTYEHTGAGITVTARWAPTSFSSGEMELWHALGHLARHGTLPEVDETHLDDMNRQALDDARAVLRVLKDAS